MTRHVPISEFKDHASELVAAAERGEEILITRHGKVAAVLRQAAPEANDQTRARDAMARILARRDAMRSAGMTATIDELIAWKNEGRR
jgi:prevent-host-death family protein